VKKQDYIEYKHLSMADRFVIEGGMNRGYSFKQIARTLDRAASTISREVKRHRVFVDAVPLVRNDCTFRPTCKASNLCEEACRGRCAFCTEYDCRSICEKYESLHCPQLDKAPFICNSCQSRVKCKRRHAYYTAQRAQSLYLSTLREARSGVRATPEKLHEIDNLIKPLLLRGQSLNHIFATHAEKLGCSRKTIYNYIDNRALSTKNIDLPRKVRYRKRKKPKPAYKLDYMYRHGRTISAYQNFLELYPNTTVVEMDTVIGKRTKGKALLTMVFKDSGFMLIFIMPDRTHKSVLKIFDDLTDMLGLDEFRRLFQVILTDNGVEFKNAAAFEFTRRNDRRTRMFYCDPQAAWQKPHIERNHQFIRYVIPRFTSFDTFTQEDMTLLSNHINSFHRDRLDGKSPFDVAEKHINQLLEVLGLARIPPDDVLLKPALLKR